MDSTKMSLSISRCILEGANGWEMKKEAGSTFVLPAIIRTLSIYEIIPAILASVSFRL
jgi:hypothetical protein